MAQTAHVDTFARDRLPPAHALPERILERGGLAYPQTLNAAEELLDRHVAEGNGARRAIVAEGGTVWTYERLMRTANRIARVLREDFGLVPGNRVLLRAPNCPMLAACWFAVLKAGGIAVTTMPLYRKAELRTIAEKARIRLALCDARLREELDAACEEFGGISVVPFHTDDPDGLEARMERKPDTFENVATAGSDIALIAFTSGTTGKPKAAMHDHHDLLATCDTFGAHIVRPKPGDLFTGSPPLAFTFGLGGLLLFPMRAGAATLLLEKAGPEQLLKAIAEYGVTTLFTAPIAYRTMSNLVERYSISTLHTCVSAGETLPKAVWDAWHAKTGLKIVDGIGSTEMLHVFIASPKERAKAGSTGQVVPGYVAEIHDESGRPVPPGTVGRLAVKGPTGCRYLEDARQSEYVRGGWNYPGDAYRCDEDGYFWYVARTDDMIVSAGYNISGPEVEQALLQHADVHECAVVAKPDPEHGTQIVKAFVVLAKGVPPSDAKAEELREFCKTAIAAFKAPREVEFVSELPRTETGKVQRFKLRERVR